LLPLLVLSPDLSRPFRSLRMARPRISQLPRPQLDLRCSVSRRPPLRHVAPEP